MQLWLWFIGLCLGTLIFNFCWYWIRLREALKKQPPRS
jgi:hypothetical protein